MWCKGNISMCSLLILACGLEQTVAQNPASNKPNASMLMTPVTTSTPVAKPPAYRRGALLNYVRTKEAVAPIHDEASFNSAGYEHVKQTTQFLDGLGRPLQTVYRQATPGSNPKDIVAPLVYDNIGREKYNYLPYAQIIDNSNGHFKVDPFGDQEYFYKLAYKDAFGNVMHDGEDFFIVRRILRLHR